MAALTFAVESMCELEEGETFGRDEAVARLEGLGVRRVDLGEGDRPWVVVVDPQATSLRPGMPRRPQLTLSR